METQKSIIDDLMADMEDLRHVIRPQYTITMTAYKASRRQVVYFHRKIKYIR